MVIAAGYRDVSDLYNKIIPIFWGPFKVFISNNIRAADYAKNVKCPVYIIGSTADKVLNASLQEKLSRCFKISQTKIFENLAHEDYLYSDDVINYINQIIA